MNKRERKEKVGEQINHSDCWIHTIYTPNRSILTIILICSDEKYPNNHLKLYLNENFHQEYQQIYQKYGTEIIEKQKESKDSIRE